MPVTVCNHKGRLFTSVLSQVQNVAYMYQSACPKLLLRFVKYDENGYAMKLPSGSGIIQEGVMLM